ncbi:hypothetical protein [Streptomyces viridosporus]|uniref:hypothetical protein n=1 Tax=Streptomyces viridosporus TaxID=67581 RepID=UPI0001AF1B0B|nr:hypothetical protein [Streptomyces viridosporus]
MTAAGEAFGADPVWREAPAPVGPPCPARGSDLLRFLPTPTPTPTPPTAGALGPREVYAPWRREEDGPTGRGANATASPVDDEGVRARLDAPGGPHTWLLPS